MSANPEIRAHGLRMELALRPMRGAPVPGPHPMRWASLLWPVPAAVLILTVLVVPTAITIGFAVATTPAVPLWCAVGVAAVVAAVLVGRHLRRADPAGGQQSGSPRPVVRAALPVVTGVVLTAVIGTVGSHLDPAGARAYLFTLLMVVLSVGLVAVALFVAQRFGDRWWMWLPTVAPCAVAALVSGVAFRLIFQRLADYFDIGSQPAMFWWFCLLPPVAFAWTWFGFAAALLRDGVLTVRADPVREAGMAAARSRWERHRRMLRELRPVLLVLAVGIGVAAARMFDAVLIGVPWSLQGWNQGATVFWWRMATDSDASFGPEAVYALPLVALVGVIAWYFQSDTGGRPARAAGDTPRPHDIHRRPGPRRIVAAVVVFLVFACPILVLVSAAFYGPYGFQLDAVSGLVRDEALMRSLASTGWVALATTLLVLTAAVPAAHRLAARRAGSGWARAVVVGLVVLAVLPVQVYLGPIVWVVERWGLYGTQGPLILVHAAAGLPIAILILRASLPAPGDGPAADALHGLATHATTVRRVLDSTWPALGAVAVLQLVQVWNDFTVGFLLGGAGGSPWSLLLWGEARQFEENSARLAAGSLLSAVVPVVLLLVTWRRWMVPGLTGGAVR
ncbi:hypothetical protein [Nocardia higoensis]|uniref:hypothetical protein n=1 Tax=Nocardia higoensis TaxID=228599 RepID=UPI00059347AF|nr:hypothetical protein [Nocardia higoensis]